MGADRVDKAFLADLVPSYYSNVFGTYDPVRRMIWWAYPGQGSSNGVPNKLLGYNWQLQRFAPADVAAEYLARMVGIGYSLDELYTILGYTLDNLPASLDSPIWQGGQPNLGFFDTTHKLAYMTGPFLAATVATQEMEPLPGRRMFVTGTRPLIDGSGLGVAVAIGHRERQTAPVLYTNASPINSLGACPLRSSGRYFRAPLTVAAGGDWTNIAGVDLDLVPQGKR